MKYTPRQLANKALAMAKKTATWKRLEREGRLPTEIGVSVNCPKLRKSLDVNEVWSVYGYATQPFNPAENERLNMIAGYVFLQLDAFSVPPVALIDMRISGTGTWYREGLQELSGIIAQCAQVILTRKYIVRFIVDEDVVETQKFSDARQALTAGCNWSYAKKYENVVEPNHVEVLRVEGNDLYSLFWQSDNGDIDIEIDENDPDYALVQEMIKIFCD